MFLLVKMFLVSVIHGPLIIGAFSLQFEENRFFWVCHSKSMKETSVYLNKWRFSEDICSSIEDFFFEISESIKHLLDYMWNELPSRKKSWFPGFAMCKFLRQEILNLYTIKMYSHRGVSFRTVKSLPDSYELFPSNPAWLLL